MLNRCRRLRNGTMQALKGDSMKQNGITLIELMIVVLVLGVLAATTAPVVANAYHRRAVRTAADEFRSSHALARSVAMKYGRRASLHVEAVRFWIEADTGTASGVTDTISHVRELEWDVQMSSNRNLLCFNTKGLPSVRPPCSAPDATVVFTLGDHADTVKISPVGRVAR